MYEGKNEDCDQDSQFGANMTVAPLAFAIAKSARETGSSLTAELWP